MNRNRVLQKWKRLCLSLGGCVVAGCASGSVAGSSEPSGIGFFGQDPGRPHGRIGRFYSPYAESKKGFFDFLKWQWTRERKAWPEWVESDVKWEPVASLGFAEVAVHFVNHATVLIEFGGLDGERVRLLTDPVWSERVSPVSFAGPKRVRAPGIAFDDLPKIDFVMVSHNHYDHLDTESLRRLLERDRPLILCPLGDGALISSLQPNASEFVRELDWWQFISTEKSGLAVEIVFTPAQHWSARGLFDRMASLWGSYSVKVQPAGSGKTPFHLYFAGDTGYSDHFKELNQRRGPVDLALLPIGAYEPRWFMATHHINPEEAVKAHFDLRSQRSIAIHYRTFQLTDEGIDEPAVALERALEEKGVAPESFLKMKEGETLRLPVKN